MVIFGPPRLVAKIANCRGLCKFIYAENIRCEGFNLAKPVPTEIAGGCEEKKKRVYPLCWLKCRMKCCEQARRGLPNLSKEAYAGSGSLVVYFNYLRFNNSPLYCCREHRVSKMAATSLA